MLLLLRTLLLACLVLLMIEGEDGQRLDIRGVLEDAKDEVFHTLMTLP